MLTLEVITPVGSELSVKAQTITAPGSEGEFQVLPSHLPALVLLGGGTLKYASGSEEGQLFIRGGVVEVSPQGHVLVLTEEVQKPDQLDLERAEQLKATSEKALADDQYLTDARLSQIHQDMMFAKAVLNA